MPQARLVVLNYDPANAAAPFGPAPRQIAVSPSDTIQFRIGQSTRDAHPDCKLRITLHKDQHFTPGAVQHGSSQTGKEDLAIGVRAVPAAALAAAASPITHVITGYKCELLDAGGNPIPGMVVDGSDSGGEIVPDSVG